MHGQPELMKTGLLCKNVNGTWYLSCEIGANLCETHNIGRPDFIRSENYNLTIILSIEPGCNRMKVITCDHSPQNTANSPLVPAIISPNNNSSKPIPIENQVEAVEDLPWIVSIYLNGGYACLGVLIHKRWVLVDKRCIR